MISVMVPTRGRVADLVGLVLSVDATSQPGEVELVFRIDDDDPESAETLALLGQSKVLVGPRGRGYADLPVFFNDMAKVATGTLLMCGNDDMRFETTGWVPRLESVARQYPDGLVNLGVSTLNQAVFPFSCLPRAAVDRLGFINDQRLLWSDVFLREVFESCDRAIPVLDVRVTHLRERRPDITRIEASEIEQATTRTPEYWALQERCVTEAIARLGLKRLFVREVVR